MKSSKKQVLILATSMLMINTSDKKLILEKVFCINYLV